MSKRGTDGRFVKYLCDYCEDEGSVGCSSCNGSGIGSHGPIETSRCSSCGGDGEVPCECQDGNEDYEDYEEYDHDDIV